MNQHRTKLAASKAEAGEIIRLCRKFYGHGGDAVDYLEHALFDPVWALHNLRGMAGYRADAEQGTESPFLLA